MTSLEGVERGSPSAMATLAIVCVCLALGAIGALEAGTVSAAHGIPLDWTVVVAATTPRWIHLAIVLPFVFHLALRMPLVPFRARVVGVHLALFVGLSLSQAIVSVWAMGFTSHEIAMVFTWWARLQRNWYGTLPTMILAYGAVLVAAWGLNEARERQRRTLRASQLEAQLQAARVASLRAQLQPHFLYNTLNGISALVSALQPTRAVAAIEQLGELLHASLRDDGREEITIEEEVALADRYLALQAMRFGERLHYELRVAPAVADYLVPVLLLQPIVENAVIHGLDTGQEVLRVSLSATETATGVELRVENDGADLETIAEPAARQGVGLALTRARLETCYGEKATLSLLPRDGGGAIVRILLPRFPRRAEPSSERARSDFAEATS